MAIFSRQWCRSCLNKWTLGWLQDAWTAISVLGPFTVKCCAFHRSWAAFWCQVREVRCMMCTRCTRCACCVAPTAPVAMFDVLGFEVCTASSRWFFRGEQRGSWFRLILIGWSGMVRSGLVYSDIVFRKGSMYDTWISSKKENVWEVKRCAGVFFKVSLINPASSWCQNKELLRKQGDCRSSFLQMQTIQRIQAIYFIDLVLLRVWGEFLAYRAVCRASFVDLEASGNEADCQL